MTLEGPFLAEMSNHLGSEWFRMARGNFLLVTCPGWLMNPMTQTKCFKQTKQLFSVFLKFFVSVK